jgi:hypothetical protein
MIASERESSLAGRAGAAEGAVGSSLPLGSAESIKPVGMICSVVFDVEGCTRVAADAKGPASALVPISAARHRHFREALNASFEHRPGMCAVAVDMHRLSGRCHPAISRSTFDL